MSYPIRRTKSVLICACALGLGLIVISYSYASHIAKSRALIRSISAPVNEVDSRPPSVFSMTQVEREKFQQQQVDKFCKEHQIPYLDLKNVSSTNLHIWINNKTQTSFCYVPKVGCTTLKALYYLALGKVPKSMVNETYEESENFHHMTGQITLEKLSSSKRLEVMSTYYKFVMVRHPLERLVSAYRDKFEGVPLLQGVSHDQMWIVPIQRSIYQFVDPKGYTVWMAEGGTRPITISFTDMIRFMIRSPGSGKVLSDEHLVPFLTLCDPCRIRYDYYGNFKTFNKDAAVLVDKYGVGMDMLRSKYSTRNTTTDHLTHAFYDTLTDDLKIGLVNHFAMDLDFYYHIFPSERDNHMEILKINFTLPA